MSADVYLLQDFGVKCFSGCTVSSLNIQYTVSDQMPLPKADETESERLI